MRYIAFNKRSSLTAKLLAEELDARTINGKKFKFKPSLLLRWGNSYLECPPDTIELNSLEAVKKTSNKLEMAKILSSTPEAKFPKVWFIGEDKPESMNGRMYFRNKFNQARLREVCVEGDFYATEIIDKVREFRVHVFDGEIMGVYEKIPYEGNPDYWKDDVCQFKRLDTSCKESMNGIKGVRPAAKAAVKALGLLFGGADVMIDSSGKVYVNEVNSAPALNSENIKRFTQKIKDYVDRKSVV